MNANKASLIIFEGSQLLDATTVASLAILLSISGVTQMYKILGLEVRVVATKLTAIKLMIKAMVGVMGRLVVGPMPWMPMSSRALQCTSLKGIKQGHLVIMSLGLTRLSQKTEFKNCLL